MSLFTKQQKVNKTKLIKKKLVKGNVKFDAMNPVYGKLKGNNNKLAQVLSLTRGDNKLLFSQNVEFSKEIQMLHQACREREVVITELHKSLKEMLRILDPLTNVITKSIQISKKFIPEEQIVSRQGNAAQAIIENYVTTPAVSTNHDIAKAAVEQRKANDVRMNNIIELNAIEEESTEFMNNPTENADSMPSTSYVNASTASIMGREQKLRLLRGISIQTARPFDAREETSCVEAYGLSGRLSDVYARRHSKNMLMGQTQSPRVRRSNATTLQSNSHASNIEMSQDARSEDWLDNSDGLSHKRNDHMTASELCMRDVREEHGKSHDVIPHRQATNHLPSNDVIDGRSRKPTMHDQQRGTIHSVIPKNQRGWIFCDQSNCFSSWNNNLLSCIDTTGKRLNKGDKNQMISEPVRSDEVTSPITMELTECIKTAQQQQNAANIGNTGVSNTEQCTVQNDGVYDKNVCEHWSEIRHESINESAINISEKFITTSRGVPPDDDDEDTMILRSGSTAQNKPFSFTELRLPVLNDLTISHRDKSKPETTGPTHGQSSTHRSGNTSIDLPPSSDIEIQNTSSDSCTLLLSLSRRTSTPNRPKKKWRRIDNRHNDCDGDTSSSDCDELANREKLPIRKKKIFGTKQSSPDITKQAGSSKRRKASTITEVPGLQRPKRAKAPINLKEPMLNTKLRRN